MTGGDYLMIGAYLVMLTFVVVTHSEKIEFICKQVDCGETVKQP
jgi:hypothetical protein